MVTPLDPQKGFDLLLEIWDAFLDRKVQLVILGSGAPRYERQLLAQADRYPGRVVMLQGFKDPLARRIYAGSDLFLMPSLYEPCGLGQLIALRYGSVPLVHSTGGLADTIIDPREDLERANGFRFNEYSGAGLLEGLDRTLSTYSRRQDWDKLVKHGMRQDFSWRRAADSYSELYRRIQSDRSG
jgi:starch synthase